MPAKLPGPGVAAKSQGSTTIKPRGKTQTDGAIAPAHNETTGLARNITSGPEREGSLQRKAGANKKAPAKSGWAPKVPAALKPQGKGVK